MKRRLALLVLVGAAILASGPLSASAAPAAGPTASTWNVLNNPVDPFQTLPWGDYSFWLQPWRSYMDTPPASNMLDAIGINFNVSRVEADAAAHLLADSGVTRARVEVEWSDIDPVSGGILPSNEQNLDAKFTALKKYGIRPLVLLNANDGDPAPNTAMQVNVTARAPAGATSVQLDSASAAAVTPGYTGFTGGTHGVMAWELILAVDSAHVAHLSQPLTAALPVGKQTVNTFKYLPFYPHLNPNGTVNAKFQATLDGWLAYTGTVSKYLQNTFGRNFDLEVWNELTFGSNYLFAKNYYASGFPASGSYEGQLTAILDATVAYVRNPANGIPGRVGIGDGFANTTPWASGADTPGGLTAIDKHPYPGLREFPTPGFPDPNHGTPLNALGQTDGIKNETTGAWSNFVPRFDSFYPEYWLSGMFMEELIRDLSPIITDVYGTPHGRNTHQPGFPPPTMWITEDNLAPGGGPIPTWDDDTVNQHIMAKDTLRFLSSYVNKGVTGFYFFAARGGSLGLVDQSFYDSVDANGGAFPGDAAGGQTMAAMRNFRSVFAGGTISNRRALSLTQIADNHNNRRFLGDGTAAHPALYDRDMLGFFPFQVTDNKFVAPVYVMTTNIKKVYNSSLPASDPTRFDMPPETFRLTIGGLNAATAHASLVDPITGTSAPTTIVSRSGTQIVVQLNVTDSVRLLSLTD